MPRSLSAPELPTYQAGRQARDSLPASKHARCVFFLRFLTSIHLDLSPCGTFAPFLGFYAFFFSSSKPAHATDGQADGRPRRVMQTITIGRPHNKTGSDWWACRGTEPEPCQRVMAWLGPGPVRSKSLLSTHCMPWKQSDKLFLCFWASWCTFYCGVSVRHLCNVDASWPYRLAYIGNSQVLNKYRA